MENMRERVFAHYYREWRFYYYYSQAYHFTTAFRITLDWFNIGTATRSRCKDARKNTSQKAVCKEKGASAKSAYHGHDYFGLKSTAFFVAFFSLSTLLFSISPTISGVYVYVQRASVVRAPFPRSSHIERVRRPSLGGRREREEKKIYAYAMVYIEAFRSPSAPECKATDVLRACAHFFTPFFGGLPRNFFLDSISRLPRDRIVEMARALFRVSCRKDEGAGCDEAYCPIPTCGKWKEPSNGERKTNRFSCENRIVFIQSTLQCEYSRVSNVH